MKNEKRPTRRKPDRPNNQHYFSTIPDYSPPWYTALYALLVVGLFLGIPAVMSWTYLMGIWG